MVAIKTGCGLSRRASSGVSCGMTILGVVLAVLVVLLAVGGLVVAGCESAPWRSVATESPTTATCSRTSAKKRLKLDCVSSFGSSTTLPMVLRRCGSETDHIKAITAVILTAPTNATRCRYALGCCRRLLSHRHIRYLLAKTTMSPVAVSRSFFLSVSFSCGLPLVLPSSFRNASSAFLS